MVIPNVWRLVYNWMMDVKFCSRLDMLALALAPNGRMGAWDNRLRILHFLKKKKVIADGAAGGNARFLKFPQET